MITFPKRGNEKTHQQNGVDTFNNTNKTKYCYRNFAITKSSFEEKQLNNCMTFISISICRKTGSFII